MATDNSDNGLLGSTTESSPQSGGLGSESGASRSAQARSTGRGRRGRAGAAIEDDNALSSAGAGADAEGITDESNQDQKSLDLRGYMQKAQTMAREQPLVAMAAGIAFGFILRGLLTRRSRAD
jgi:hypothetical protein